jgi:Arc/MetJ-type ribon-helix-helix transcriptional regulator
MKVETVSIGPVRIPKEHKEGLDQLKAGKAHITYSDLLREAIYLLLVERGIIDEQKPIT